VANTVNRGTRINIDEDQGVADFGVDLANQLDLFDKASVEGNNPEIETITEVKIEIQENEPGVQEFILDGFFANLTEDILFANLPNGTVAVPDAGTAVIFFVEADRSYEIRSTLVPNGAATTDEELLAFDQETRETAMADILTALALFSFEVGPEHNTEEGELIVSVTTADVNFDVLNGVGLADSKTNTWEPLRVRAIADTPTLTVVNPAPTVVLEDEGNIPLSITVETSDDNSDVDNSEVLSVVITLPIQDIVFPLPGSSAIGSIEFDGTLPDGVTITNTGEGVFLIEADPSDSTPLEREQLLNDVLESGNLVFNPRDGWGETLVDDEGLRVDLISTERESGQHISPGDVGGDDGDSRTETVTLFIGVEVTPVADIPNVESKGNAIGREDVSIQRELNVLADGYT
jgi:hypothetical protein